jgi:hypothetical protein
MKFVLGKSTTDTLENKSSVVFYTEDTTFSGVNKIADKVRKDIERVTATCPDITSDKEELGKYAVIYGTMGHSAILEELNSRGLIDLSVLKGKWEVYLFQLVKAPLPGVESALVIAGSDKRGTIYGLFHLSECIGVSPLVDWSDVRPVKKEQVVLTDHINMVSRVPSVKYRGFFINDEWPAFGNWTMHHFGGFNAEMYDHVFELLLRLKGNYLWPAMWSSNFNLDGPGLLNAELADEYGIVMGTSHHEPCIRNGEEYGLVQGRNSVYGDAWNFRTNREGIVRFWEDGLKRNGKFENVITLGMRGEQDTAILGENATLADNIALLRDVLKEQNRLIKENVNESLEDISRLLVLFTEVEAFFYGDETTQGLMGDKELDGVTLMLCDDNFGNVRSLPNEKMRQHNGGYGLYYHLDFHGGAYAYDWMNTNYLPKMWEQLTMAYDYGIRDVWVANVGDISLLEYPLSYFLDLAYDMDKWGTKAPNKTDEYTKGWINTQFGGDFSEEDRKIIHEIMNGYTRINHNRKPEIMNSTVYHPVHFGEADTLLEKSIEISEKAERLKKKCPEAALPAYFELVYFPAVASVNVQRMQILASKNELYAKQGRIEANDYADEIAECIARDRELTEEFHTIGDGKWYGMGMSEHIGFVSWCDEGCKYPIMMKIEPANKPRMIVAPANSTTYKVSGSWRPGQITIRDFLHQDVQEVNIDIALGSRPTVDYQISTSCPWLRVSRRGGCLLKKDVLILSIDRRYLLGKDTGEVLITSHNDKIVILVEAENVDTTALEPMTFLESEGYIVMEAEHYYRKYDVKNCGFQKLDNYGRTLSAMKILPPICDFTMQTDRPYVEYCFVASQEGMYTIDFYLAPSNTAFIDRKLYFGIQINEGEIKIENAVSDKFKSLDLSCLEWVSAVRDNIRIYKSNAYCRKGINNLRIYAVSPALVLERIVLYSENSKILESYLGPAESYYIK